MIPPYGFLGAYGQCYATPNEPMDPRHVYMLHGVLSRWPFAQALELGSWFGASSTAFVEAIHAGQPLTATFCDITPTPGLKAVLAHCRQPERVRLTTQPSWEVLESADPYDFILVDTNHDLKTVSRELEGLLPRRPLCVMAHDTNASARGYRLCEGAALLKRTFQQLPGYRCLEDAEFRQGERTERGLFLATTDEALFGVARRAFTACGWSDDREPEHRVQQSYENWPTALHQTVGLPAS